MKIPTVLHHGLFNGYQPNALERRCMAGWSSALPGWEIKLWSEINGPMDRPFFREACASRPANASSYTRLWVLFNYGGVFVDTDIEILKPFELDHGAFLGIQREDVEAECVNSAVLGSVAGHSFTGECLQKLDEMGPQSSEVECGPNLVTRELRKRGLKGTGEQLVGDIKVFGKSVFYPFRWDETPERRHLKPETVAIHWWNGSWATRHPAARDNFPDAP